MTLIGHAYHYDEPKLTMESLAARGCCGSPDNLVGLVQTLKGRRLLVATKDEPEALLPARSLETIPLGEIVTAVRGQGGGAVRLPSVQEVVDRIDSAVSGSLEGKTLKDLVLANSEAVARLTVRQELPEADETASVDQPQ
jgi:DNA-binding IscR family transcriptional regulator